MGTSKVRVMWMDPIAHLIPWAAHCLLVFSPIWAYILYCKVYVSPKMQRSIHPNLHLIALSGSLLVSTFPRRNICKLSLSYPPKWTIKTTRLHFPQSRSPLIKQHWNWTSVSLRNRHNRRGGWPFCHQEQSSDSFTDMGCCDASGGLCLCFFYVCPPFWFSTDHTLWHFNQLSKAKFELLIDNWVQRQTVLLTY